MNFPQIIVNFIKTGDLSESGIESPILDSIKQPK